MARQTRELPYKKAIYVFWEGESEEAYTKYLRQAFKNKSVINIHGEKGTFHTAQSYYRGNKRFQNDIHELDEIWFFFDTEIEKGGQWDENWECLKSIIETRKQDNPIRICLLMTTCCIEYWFLLHYERTAPSIATPADKERVTKRLRDKVASYKKGNYQSITAIASQNQKEAIDNGRWTLKRLEQDGMPMRSPDNTSESDKWLFKGTSTFTTVHEALEMLINLPDINF